MNITPFQIDGHHNFHSTRKCGSHQPCLSTIWIRSMLPADYTYAQYTDYIPALSTLYKIYCKFLYNGHLVVIRQICKIFDQLVWSLEGGGGVGGEEEVGRGRSFWSVKTLEVLSCYVNVYERCQLSLCVWEIGGFFFGPCGQVCPSWGSFTGNFLFFLFHNFYTQNLSWHFSQGV